MSRRDTDKDWRTLAETEPYWSVLSQDQFKAAALSDESRGDFFRSGETQIADLFAFVERHFGEPLRPLNALDFGCGVGRLLLPMARRSERVTGLDISPRMLQLCRDNASDSGVFNIRLELGDDSLSALGTEQYDLVNSIIVLQHIDPKRGYRLLATLLDRLAAGGFASLQLTYAKSRKFLKHEEGRAYYYRRDGDTLTDLVSTPNEPPIGHITMFDYDLNQVIALISRVSGHPILVLPTNDDDHLGVHLVFRKALDAV